MIIAISLTFGLVTGAALGFILGKRFGGLEGFLYYLVRKGFMYHALIWQRSTETYERKYFLTLNTALKFAMNWWCKERDRTDTTPGAASVTINGKSYEKVFNIEC